MIQTLNTRYPKQIPAEILKTCPFCKADMYWMEVEHQIPFSTANGVGYKSKWRLHFYHPGVATDKDCILSGHGFLLSELDRWNTRFE